MRDDDDGRGETLAEVVDRLFVPALAAPWAVRVADAAQLAPGAGSSTWHAARVPSRARPFAG